MTTQVITPFLRIGWPDDVAEIDLAPLQGLWSADQYLKLTDQTNRLIELTDGVIEVLPMPTREHQKILAYLYRSLFALLQSMGGIVLFAPLAITIAFCPLRSCTMMRATPDATCSSDILRKTVSLFLLRPMLLRSAIS